MKSPTAPVDSARPAEAFAAQLDEILRLLRQNRLILPGVPELANRIRAAIADPASTVAHIAELISADPALTAHLIKVAGSVALRRGGEIHDIRTAVTRLGLRLTAMSATSFSIMQMMALAVGQQARVRALYEHSVAVGERCYALARRAPALVPEDALLLGLVHDIGVLPVLNYAHRRRDLASPARLEALIAAVHAPVGAELLRGWRFPESLVTAVESHESADPGGSHGRPSYTDLLVAANLDIHGGGQPISPQDMQSTPALRRLGLRADASLMDQLSHAADTRTARQLVGLGYAAPGSDGVVGDFGAPSGAPARK